MSDTEKSTEADVAAAAEETAAAEDTVAESAPGEEPAATEDAAPAEPAAAAEAEEPAPAEEATAAEAAPAEEAPAEEPAAAGEAAAADEPSEPERPAAPEHTFDTLKGKTVVQLREIAESLGDLDVLHGYTTMHKEELLVALCKALGVEAHEHHEVVGIDKAAVKAKIRALKQEREALLAANDSKQLRIVRRRIRGLKRKIRKATV